MVKEDIIKEIKDRRKFYGTLKEDQFYFGYFVSKYDYENHCGTVCCLWGWEPAYNPNVRWMGDVINYDPHDKLNWGQLLIDYLYYPNQAYCLYDYIDIELESNSSLSKVLSAWDKVIQLLETGNQLDQFLNLD